MNVRAMVLQYEEELGNSRWVDFVSGHRTEQSLISALREGVRRGDWGAWRLITVHREVMGNEQPQVDARRGFYNSTGEAR